MSFNPMADNNERLHNAFQPPQSDEVLPVASLREGFRSFKEIVMGLWDVVWTGLQQPSDSIGTSMQAPKPFSSHGLNDQAD